MIKISFDFDDTLSLEKVQKLSIFLSEHKPYIEQWIVTERFSEDSKKMLYDAQNLNIDNQDIFEIAKKLTFLNIELYLQIRKEKKIFLKIKIF